MASAAVHPRVAASTQEGLALSLGFFFAARSAVTVVAFQSAPAAGTAFIITFGFLFAFAAWCVSSHVTVRGDRNLLTWLKLYLLLMAVSLLWTAAKSPSAAFAYWTAIAADCAAVYFLMRDVSPVEYCERLMVGFAWGAVLVGVIAWNLPTMWDLRIGDEEYLHPNTVGYVAVLGLLFALQLHRRMPSMSIATFLCGTVLLRSLSKTSILGALAALGFYLLRNRNLRRKVKIAIALSTAVVIALSWTLIEAYALFYTSEYDVETLTGRTYLWSIAWEEGMKTAWFGHGLYSFRSVVPMIGNFQPWQAHNEMLQQWFCFGLLGLFLYVILHLSLWRAIRRYPRSEFATLAGAVLVFAMVRGLVDTENVSVNYPLWLMALFAFVLPRSIGQEA